MGKVNADLKTYLLNETGDDIEALLDKIRRLMPSQELNDIIAELRAAIAEKIDSDDVKAHKNAAVIDHPDGSVTGNKIADSAITNSHISRYAITPDKINVNLWSIVNTYATHNIKTFLISECLSNLDIPTADGIYILKNDTNEAVNYIPFADFYGMGFSEAIRNSQTRICITIKSSVGGADPENGYALVLPQYITDRYLEYIENQYVHDIDDNLDYNIIDYVPYDYDANNPEASEVTPGTFSVITKAGTRDDGSAHAFDECDGIAFGCDESGNPSLWFWGSYDHPKKVMSTDDVVAISDAEIDELFNLPKNGE